MGSRQREHGVCAGKGELRRLAFGLAEPDLLPLLQGKHDLTISLEHFGDTCGILPVGERAYVQTKGLKWDLGPGSCGCTSLSSFLKQPFVIAASFPSALCPSHSFQPSLQTALAISALNFLLPS